MLQFQYNRIDTESEGKVIHNHFVDANEMVKIVERVDKMVALLANAR